MRHEREQKVLRLLLVRAITDPHQRGHNRGVQRVLFGKLHYGLLGRFRINWLLGVRIFGIGRRHNKAYPV